MKIQMDNYTVIKLLYNPRVNIAFKFTFTFTGYCIAESSIGEDKVDEINQMVLTELV